MDEHLRLEVAALVLAQQPNQVVFGITLVYEQRLLQFDGQLNLPFEHLPLHGRFAEVSVVVQTALADRDTLAVGRILFQLVVGIILPRFRFVRMDSY